MSKLSPLNTYVILELTKEESLLIKPEEDIKEATTGIVVDAGAYEDIEVGDEVNFVWNAAHGNIKTVDDKAYAHVKHEHLLSKVV